MRYRIAAGKLQAPYCELNVAEHCNLRCRGCSHLSPISPRVFVAPEALEHDLTRLGRVYHAGVVRLLGGEPLLHPDLLAVIAAVRRSGIADRVRVVTNGTLLPRMPDAFWQAIDELWVSSYPGQQLGAPELAAVRAQAAAARVPLRLTDIATFRQPYVAGDTHSPSLTRQIYDSCAVIHDWRCHTVAEGYFYKCPQSYFIPRRLGAAADLAPTADGLAITDAPEFGAALRAYLEADTPLAACQRCLGTVGHQFAHRQASRAEWTSLQPVDGAQAIRRRYLLWRRGRRALQRAAGWLAASLLPLN